MLKSSQNKEYYFILFGNVKFIINAEIASNEKNGEFNPYAFGLVVDNVQSPKGVAKSK